MIEGLGQLGVAIEHDPRQQTIRVAGCGGRLPAAEADIMAGNSGTTVRFLTAVAALGHGRFRLDGTARMRQRPIQDLLDALAQLGADAVSELGSGCPPVIVRAAGLPGGRATVAGEHIEPVSQRPAPGRPSRADAGRIDRGRQTGFAALCRNDVAGDAGVWRRCRRRVRRRHLPHRPEPVSGGVLRDRTRCLGRQLLPGRRSHHRRQRDRRGAQPAEPSRRRCLLRLPGANGLPGPRRRRRPDRGRRPAAAASRSI